MPGQQRRGQQQLRRLLWSLALALLALVVACSASAVPSTSASLSASRRTPAAGFLQPKAKAEAPPSPSCCSNRCHHQQQARSPCQQALHASTATNSGGGSAEPTRTCRNCKQQYRASENGDRACRYHRGIFTGRLARIDDADPSGDKDWFWSCCGEEAKDGPGCTVGPHQSYDDPPGPWTSGFQ